MDKRTRVMGKVHPFSITLTLVLASFALGEDPDSLLQSEPRAVSLDSTELSNTASSESNRIDYPDSLHDEILETQPAPEIKKDSLTAKVGKKSDTAAARDSNFVYDYIAHPILQVVTWPIEFFLVPTLNLAFYPVKPPLRYVMRENVLDRASELISFGKSGNIKLYPILAITTGTGSLTGFTYRHSNLTGDEGRRLILQYMVYVNADQRLKARLYQHDLFESPLDLKYYGSLSLFKNRSVYPPGVDIGRNYSDSSWNAGLESSYPIFEKFNAMVDVRYQKFNYQNSPIASQQIRCDEGSFFVGANCLRERGIGERFRDFSISTGFQRNTMNNDNIPTQGSKVHFNWGYHFTDNFHDFHRWEFKTNRYFFLGVERYEITRAEQKETGNLDFKKIKKLMEYKNLKNKIFDRKVITTQFVVSQTHGVDGHNVPFYALSAVGNDTPMRGYKSSPFRDNAMLAFSAEYRFPMMMLVEGTLFNEYGMVGERLDKLDPADIKNSWGFGMRFSRKDFFLFRTQVGFHGSHLVPVFNLTVSAAY